VVTASEPSPTGAAWRTEATATAVVVVSAARVTTAAVVDDRRGETLVDGSAAGWVVGDGRAVSSLNGWKAARLPLSVVADTFETAGPSGEISSRAIPTTNATPTMPVTIARPRPKGEIDGSGRWCAGAWAPATSDGWRQARSWGGIGAGG
jgi:hypothetical protein